MNAPIELKNYYQYVNVKSTDVLNSWIQNDDNDNIIDKWTWINFTSIHYFSPLSTVCEKKSIHKYTFTVKYLLGLL